MRSLTSKLFGFLSLCIATVVAMAIGSGGNGVLAKDGPKPTIAIEQMSVIINNVGYAIQPEYVPFEGISGGYYKFTVPSNWVGHTITIHGTNQPASGTWSITATVTSNGTAGNFSPTLTGSGAWTVDLWPHYFSASSGANNGVYALGTRNQVLANGTGVFTIVIAQ